MLKRLSRRDFLRYLASAGAVGAGVVFVTREDLGRALAAPNTPVTHGAAHLAAATPVPHKRHGRAVVADQALPGGTLDPLSVPKYVTPLLIPPVMPRNTRIKQRGGQNVDYYEISVRQLQQQILPAGLPKTTVWGYGAYGVTGTHNAPSFTIEAKWNRPVRVKWINDLVKVDTVDGQPVKTYLPHLLPVDQTLHWANPPGGTMHRDHVGSDPLPYTGPVPIVTHVHGAHTTDESDGYAEAWFLPPVPPPAGYATEGTWYQFFRNKAKAKFGADWAPGSATFQYPNDQNATTLWYHDHTLGMTRVNVYAGPAGFYIIRGGPGDAVTGTLPGPAPKPNDPPGKKYYEIPIAIQDRSFNRDGSLFFPDNRAFFEGLEQGQLQIPFIPDEACGAKSDISPIWNPEFFGNTMMVNGNTWPNLNVEPRRYRFRFLNGCNSRFLILKIAASDTAGQGAAAALPFWQIGAEGGFLPNSAVMLDTLLMSPAERADVIVDFTGVAPGTALYMINEGPDSPFGGGVPGADFPYADPETTGQVMKFTVVPLTGADPSTPPAQLVLPALAPLPVPAVTRQVSLNELDSNSVYILVDGDGNPLPDANGNIVAVCPDTPDAPGVAPFGPRVAVLGSVNLPAGAPPEGVPLLWMDPITENPAPGATETWEIYNFTMDAHPIHVHEVMFEVVNREAIGSGAPRLPEAWEAGQKDTVIAYPGEITRIKARFDLPGQYVWHCHIVDHEDNEMMRPFRIGPAQPGEPMPAHK